jgi:DNA-binding transcriptional ArsR family regulator
MTRKSPSELREEIRAVARGERKASSLPAAPLLAALSREALELLAVLLRKQPASVSELVDLTGRAQPNISRSLQLLARYRLIQLVREGREVRAEPRSPGPSGWTWQRGHTRRKRRPDDRRGCSPTVVTLRRDGSRSDRRLLAKTSIRASEVALDAPLKSLISGGRYWDRTSGPDITRCHDRSVPKMSQSMGIHRDGGVVYIDGHAICSHSSRVLSCQGSLLSK